VKLDRFGDHEFTEKEIKQIAALIELFTSASDAPIDRRRYEPQVVRFAERSGLARMRDGRLRPGTSSYLFSIPNDAPASAVWHIFRNRVMKEDKVGYSITKSDGWKWLNIFPRGNNNHTQKDEDEMMEILHGLHIFGFLIFQHAGSIWDICVTKKYKK
jgi:hypothetical protein